MKLVEASIRYPVSVTVAVLFALTAGVLGFLGLPVQLIPTIDRPEISVSTGYPGAGPLEVETEITDRQEEMLNTLENLKEMQSTSSEGSSTIVLKYDWGTDKDVARIDVSEKLSAVRNLPEDSRESIIRAVNSDEQSPIAWIVLRADGQDINDVRPVAEDVIKPQLERVPGVGQVIFFGGEEREVQVVLDLAALAQRSISIGQVRSALSQENRNIKAGGFDSGQRRYGVRTEGRYDQLEEIENTIISRDLLGPVRVKDIAEVRLGFEEQLFKIRQDGRRALIFGTLRKTGSNTLEVMAGVRAVIDRMNARYASKGIELHLVYDASEYVNEAIALVRMNVMLGALLAIGVLLFFLRSKSALLVIGISIPISVITSFVFLYAFGRTLNIISLAGLTFVSGMVLDNAIVVVENIFRHRELGKGPVRAAYDGATEVWGAVLASTLTTLVVFLPILLLEDEVGQISRDMAIVIAVAISISLLVAVTVIPSLSGRLLTTPPRTGDGNASRFTERITQRLLDALGWIFAERWRQAVVVLGIPALAVAFIWTAMPDRDFLPKGNRNLVFVVASTPPGYSLTQVERIVRAMEERFLAFPEIERMFAIMRLDSPMMGLIIKDEYKDKKTIQDVIKRANEAWREIPGIQRAMIRQTAIIRSGRMGSGNVQMLVQGDELDVLERISAQLDARLQRVEGVKAVSQPIELGKPEFVVNVKRARASEVGLTVAEIGSIVETSINGIVVGTFNHDGREIDLRVRSPRADVSSDRELARIVLDTPSGQTVQLGDVARIEARRGPTRIEHKDMDRALRISAQVEDDVALGTAIARIEEAIAPIRAALPLGYAIEFTGTAGDLSRTEWMIYGVIALAVFVTYLLLASLFESFSLPFVIIMTVPFAASGGILGLLVLRWVDPTVKLDAITMMGFVILVGVVVNNAILIVHQTLNRLDGGAEPRQALLDAVASRVRPILMTTATTTFGLLPLVIAAGSGSELYRGLGTVLVGGLSVSALFTLILVPSLLSLTLARVRRPSTDVADALPAR